MTREAELQLVLNQPERIISRYNLIYAHEEDLSIVRKKQGKGFSYLMNGKSIKEKAEIKRIKSLVIPPMWDDVRISSLENSHLQAIGRDSKNRKQYLYHTHWNKIRNTTKFYKMYSFGKKLPLIRKQMDRDLDKKGWPKEKAVALVIRLMEETHIRIGNSYYEKKNKTYGLTTLRKRHINIYKGKLRIEFVGKKGKEHRISVRNKKLVRLVNRCEELTGWTLFKFFDENGEKKTIKSNHVNEYLQKFCGKDFTAKDFRTWSASVSFFNALLEFGKATSEDEIKKNILKAYDVAANTLGNTRNVCRKYYVHPVIVDTYEKGNLYKTFNKIEKVKKVSNLLSPSEKEILKLFKTYSPKLRQKNN
ncbi:DNA topoisomerase IB [Mariniflexile litorale]|uniref:DNA topoisomerase n=1 Tax=Mariniflexile litorale TaxID=3045158 RepID=A0AAU7EEL3_9FLAO|nr:DNA topoisomerase IB [Mariniflexile sp. KMM 9835]MDQ8211902.1 DNA topoisomerase IB [Mariniflexile sp. KMM 9835]